MTGLVLDKRNRERGDVGLKQLYLRKVLGRRSKPALNAAQDLELLVPTQAAVPNRRCQRFRLGPATKAASWNAEHLSDERICMQLALVRQERAREASEGAKQLGRAELLSSLRKNLGQLTVNDFDVGAAISGCDAKLRAKNKRFDRQVFIDVVNVSVDMIRRRDWYCAFDEYGRLHTNLTNLWRGVRPHLRLEGQPIVAIDIACSQPLFLGVMVENEKQQRTDRKDKQEETTKPRNLPLPCASLPHQRGDFLKTVESGAFYEELRDSVDPALSRDDAKRNTLTILYADSERWQGKWIEGFRRRFPDAMDYIQRAKRTDHRQLAHRMQRLESSFIFDRVVARILHERPELPILTIHDSIATTAGNEDYVRETMAAEFGALGVEPRLKRENFTGVSK